MRERRFFVIFLLVSALIYQSSAQIESSCSNDGYYTGSDCVCSPFFTSSSKCQNRICQNDGSPRSTTSDQGCFCPLGYSSQNCEAVRCVKESSSTFQDPSEKVLAAVIPYNLDFKKKIETSSDDPVKAMCSALIESPSYSALQLFLPSPVTIKRTDIFNVTSCMNKFTSYTSTFCADEDEHENEIPIDCPNSNNLTTYDISGFITKLPARSRLYIFSNLLPFGDESSFNLAVRRAISKRIVINSIFYEQTGSLMKPGDYNKDSGYQFFRNLAEGTLGNFITPYSGVDNSLLGDTNVEESVDFLESIVRDDYAPVDAHLQTEKIVPTNVNVGLDYFFIIFRLLGDNSNQLVNFLSKPDNLELYMSTGFWYVYRAKNKAESVTSFIMSPTGSAQFTYYVHSKVRLETFTSVTTTSNIDATAPFAVETSTRTLVANIKRHSPENTDMTIQTAFFMGGTTFTQDITKRDGCSFSYALGQVKCDAIHIISLVVRDSQSVSSVTPFMCADSDSDRNQIAIFEDESDLIDDLPEIEFVEPKYVETEDQTQKLLPTHNMSRTFALVIQNHQDIIDNILIQPNNVLQSLVNYIRVNGEFEKYYYNLFSANSVNKTKEYTNFADFVTSLMNDVHSNPRNDGKADVLGALNNVYSLYMLQDFAQYSDVFLFVKCDQTEDDSSADFIEAASNSLRSRLYVAAYEDSSFTLSPNDFYIYKKLVEKTGGAFIHSKDVSDIQTKFIPFYFQNLIGSFTLDHRVQPTGASAPVLTRYIYTDTENQDISIVIQVSKGNFGPISITLNDVQLNPISINEYWYATTTNSKKGQNSLKLSFVPTSTNASFAIFTKQNAITSTLAFTDSKSRDFKQGKLEYGSSSSQYPIVRSFGTDGKDKTAQITIYDPSIAVINSVTISETRDTGDYKYFWNYSFVCSSENEIYYFKTTLLDDKNQILSEATQSLVCSKTNSCLNGGSYTGFSCICVVGFTGENCEYRMCLNNGTRNVNGLCDCAPSFTGDFCEINPNKCVNPVSSPDIRSSIGTIIFVAQPGITIDPPIDFKQLNGKQLIVASCVGKIPTILMTSTFGNDLKSSFQAVTTSSNDGDSDCLLNSLKLAMEAQTSKKGMIFLFADSGDWTIDSSMMQPIQNLFSSGRYDLRIRTEQSNHSQQLKFLAAQGNGVPIAGGTITDYMSKYVLNVFEAASLTNAITPSLNVIASSQKPPSQVIYTVYGDSTLVAGSKNLIIHYTSSNLTVLINEKPQTPVDLFGSSDNGIAVFQINAKDVVVIKLTTYGESPSYAVEVKNTAKFAFGFQDETDNYKIDENSLSLGPHQTNFILNFFVSNVVLGDSEPNMAFVELSTLGYDSNSYVESEPVVLPVSRRTDSSCLYSYYSALKAARPFYCKNAEVYKLRFVTTDKKTNTQYEIQKTVSCFAPDTPDDCNYGQIVNDECSCTEKWYGTDCSYPQCSATAKYSSKLTCDCTYDTDGLFCDQTLQGKVAALSFIIDLTGYSDYLYDVQISSIKQFVTSYKLNELRISLVGNDPTASTQNNVFNKAFSSNSDFFTSLDAFKASRTKTDLYQDISSALAALQNGNTASVDISRIFAITQRSYTVNDKTVYNSLKTTNQIIYYGLGTKYNPFSVVNDNLGDMEKTASDGSIHYVTNVDDTFSSMVNQMNVPPDATYTPSAPLSPPSCINELVANIFVQIDVSKMDNSDKIRQKLSDFLGILRNDFNTKPDTSTACDVNTKNYQWTNKASISSVLYYDKYFTNPQTISFCSTSDSTLRQKMLNINAKNDTPQWDAVFKVAEGYYSNNCSCYRLDQENVKHIIIWVPMKDSVSTPDDTRNNNYYHLTMPYNFDITKDSMFYNLAKGSLDKLGSPKTSDTTENDLFIQKWTVDDSAEKLRDNVYSKLKELFLAKC